MKYKQLEKTKENISILGFGAMRLPTKKSNGNIDKTKASEILSYGIDNGINLIDTAYPYHSAEIDGNGNSEVFIGEFLKENSYRDDVLISTKSPSWLMEKKGDFEYYLDKQLEKLKTDNIDIYLLHALTKNDWDKVRKLRVLDFLDDALSSGKIKHVGFSSYTEIDTFVDIIDAYPKWEVVLTQMNYLDEYYQTGVMGLDYLKQSNIGSMIMEPLRGGRLVQNIPPEVEKLWNTSEVKRTPVEWALEYLWNRDDIDCVLSGMNSLEQLKQNIQIATNVKEISKNDHELIREVVRTYKTLTGNNNCTSCGYCMLCPEDIDIVKCFKEYNIGKMLNNPKGSAMQYFTLIDDDKRADSCINCKKCEFVCPQMINIPQELEKVDKYFGREFNHF